MPNAGESEAVFATQLRSFSQLSFNQFRILMRATPTVCARQIGDLIGNDFVEVVVSNQTHSSDTICLRPRPVLKPLASTVTNQRITIFLLSNFCMQVVDFRLCAIIREQRSRHWRRVGEIGSLP